MSKKKIDIQEAVDQIAQTAEELGEKATEAIKTHLNIPSFGEQSADRRQIQEDIRTVLQSQREFFASGQTLPVAWRIEQLKKLYDSIKKYENDIYSALNADLLKNPFDSYATEIGIVLSEISYALRNVKKWGKIRKISSKFFMYPSKSKVFPEPFGTVLVMSPWNYPFQLSLTPLVSAIAAGNTVVLKTSEFSKATNQVIRQILSECFESNYVTVIEGGSVVNQLLLHEKFNFIFFTGSQTVGKIVMESAAKFLTPVCLELGGKSPCIVEESANIPAAARRIVWGKLLNAGQTCVAPDYVLVHESKKDEFLAAVHDEITRQFGENPLQNEEYGKIINKKHFNRLISIAPEAQNDLEAEKIAPTILDLGPLGGEKASRHPSMQEEIFGPIMPVLTYENLEDVILYVNSRPTPLALYLFATEKTVCESVIKRVQFGGGCINDVIIHLANNRLPFGGLGESGMGQYHGKAGFDCFTHYKSMVFQKEKGDFNIRITPHKNRLSFVRKILK